MRSPDDNIAVLLYNGVMKVLQPYLDNGTLVCKSGRTSFDETCILWDEIAVSAGERGHQMILSPASIATLSAASYADLTK